MAPTRREQAELDELLSDIYRGIETLPDRSARSGNVFESTATHVREYELPASSPAVRQYKKELASQRASAGTGAPASHATATGSPLRSTLKRHTSRTPDKQQPEQSLASFVTSNTPENRRRVRIVEHPDRLARGYQSSDDDYPAQSAQLRQPAGKPTEVKYVNTNKLIYHQERNPDDDYQDDEVLSNDSDQENQGNAHTTNHQRQPDELDGVTRVEYYHTTWLDKQLGRASKRRSSKELNERQVKEKAMIEELKRSLKNGAITLRQSLRGKKQQPGAKQTSDSLDDYWVDPKSSTGKKSHTKGAKQANVFGSGLATLPRNYHSHANNNHISNSVKQPEYWTKNAHASLANRNYATLATPKQTALTEKQSPVVVEAAESVRSNQQQPVQTQSPSAGQFSSRTLPHSHSQPKRSSEAHSLLDSHYRDTQRNRLNTNYNTLASSPTARNYSNLPQDTSEAMRTNFVNCASTNTLGGHKSPTGGLQQQQQQYQPQQMQPLRTGETISSLPSATQVVREALSRSSSQLSLNQLNKTINLLPNSPSPFAGSPATPTQQLKATSPSLSPSPVCSPYGQARPTVTATSVGPPMKTLYGTRTLPAKTTSQPANNFSTAQRQPQQQQQQQQVYANPHASLMQHRQEQQLKNPNRNQASIREFNELDSLLRSLSPTTSTAQIVSPGYSNRSGQGALGYGASPVPSSIQPTNRNQQDIYARVQKPQATPLDQSRTLYTPRSPAPASGHIQQPQQQYQHQQPYTIDVTKAKDENCPREELSEFEPPIELLPSMEDYQNISKLNPVKNHYWYKPNMSRDRAISLLKDKPQGTFIVRDSTSFRGAYGLAVKVAKLPKNVLRNPNADPSSELIRHFLIEPAGTGCRLKGYANEPVFNSLPSLIYQHSLTEIALPCRLIIPRADIEDPQFNMKQKQFFDDFLASKEIAKHPPYMETAPDGGFRKYPGDVYVHNEHRIIFE